MPPSPARFGMIGASGVNAGTHDTSTPRPTMFVNLYANDPVTPGLTPASIELAETVALTIAPCSAHAAGAWAVTATAKSAAGIPRPTANGRRVCFMLMSSAGPLENRSRDEILPDAIAGQPDRDAAAVV